MKKLWIFFFFLSLYILIASQVFSQPEKITLEDVVQMLSSQNDNIAAYNEIYIESLESQSRPSISEDELKKKIINMRKRMFPDNKKQDLSDEEIIAYSKRENEFRNRLRHGRLRYKKNVQRFDHVFTPLDQSDQAINNDWEKGSSFVYIGGDEPHCIWVDHRSESIFIDTRKFGPEPNLLTMLFPESSTLMLFMALSAQKSKVDFIFDAKIIKENDTEYLTVLVEHNANNIKSEQRFKFLIRDEIYLTSWVTFVNSKMLSKKIYSNHQPLDFNTRLVPHTLCIIKNNDDGTQKSSCIIDLLEVKIEETQCENIFDFMDNSKYKFFVKNESGFRTKEIQKDDVPINDIIASFELNLKE